jgi:hypothetical protein
MRQKGMCALYLSPKTRGAASIHFANGAFAILQEAEREMGYICGTNDAGMEKKNTKLTPTTLPWWPG